MKMRNFMKPMSLLCIACACLTLGACSEDEENRPPTVIPPELSYTQIGSWFEGEVPQGIDKAVARPAETDGILTSKYYMLKLTGNEKIAAELKTTTIEQTNWVYSLTFTDAEKGVDAFKAASKEYINNGHWIYDNGQYWNDAILQEYFGSPKTISSEELETTLAEADYATDNLRLGFKSEKSVVEVSIEQGIAKITVRPAKFHDNWRWYSQNFLGADFNQLINEYYFCVASSGFIPPFQQLMRFNAIDSNNTPFNLVLFSAPNSPIDRIEGAYDSDIIDHIAYWSNVLESPETEKNYGNFEQAFVFLSGQSDVITLTSAAQTVEWVKTNGLTNVEYIMPIYRISDTLVTIPQLDSDYFTIIVTALEAEQTSNKAILKTLHAK